MELVINQLLVILNHLYKYVLAFLYCHQLIADYICKLQLKLSMAYLPKIDHG